MALAGDFDFIIHGCNCHNLMGAGIAAQIAKTFPEAVEADKRRGRAGDNKKLGDYSLASVIVNKTKQLFIINAYTQFMPGADFKMFALQMFLYRFKQDQITSNGSNPKDQIGIPWIGCGIGGAQRRDVKKVLTMFAAQTPQIDLTVVALNDKHQLK